MEDNIFGKNLKYLRNKHKVDQIELAVYLGRKSGASISDWEAGRYTPRAGTLNKIAKYFRVPLSDLMTKNLKSESINKRMSAADLEEVVSMTKIPVIGTIACGEPILADENIEEYREEATARLPTGDLFYLRTKGDSMTPTIPEGSYVLIRVQSDVEDGEIAAVLVNGDTEATLKRVKRQNGMVLLMADNQKYAPYIVTSENPARILGKAVSFSADL